jgi:anhydro-N-acetylmuramic acid kinase
MRVAGIMSGTSLDGVDVAVIDIHKSKWNLIGWKSTPYPSSLREEILAVSNRDTHTRAISRLNFRLGEVYANAVLNCGVPLETIDLIGCHGQTIFHEGSNTLQIGESAIIAERTGKPVVNDFRPRDIAAGGKGAPLVPFVDYFLFRHKKLFRVALNIGGIANITVLPPGAKQNEIAAFDTGPGNMVIDALVEKATRGKQRYDRDGRIAAKGKADRKVLDLFMKDQYYRANPPKSAGREQFGAEFVERLLKTELSIENLIATATALTAATIAAAIQRFVPRMPDELIVSGGGVHNPVLMAYLAAFLPATQIGTSDDYGVDADAKEAIAFAILAYRTWHRRPGNLPSATGAAHDVVLGKITF